MGRQRRADPENDWRVSPLALVLSGMIRALAATVSIQFHDDATIRTWEREGKRFILAFWHRHLVLMRYAYRGDRMRVLVSQSWDGELTSRTLSCLGVGTVRGSSSRGGAMALREVLREARRGSDLAFTPDGPRGPLRQVQPGVLLASTLSGLPVLPVAIAASRRRLLKSWDQMLVPLPGSRVAVVYGEPVTFVPGEEIAIASERLRLKLNELEARAETLVVERR